MEQSEKIPAGKEAHPTPLSGIREQKVLARIPLETTILAGFVGLAITFFSDLTSGLLCFTGGAISALSFLWLKKSLSHFLSSNRRRALRSLLFLQFLRLGLIGLVFFIIIYFFSRKALAFMAGFSALILVILGEAIFGLSRMKSWKA